MNRTNFGIIAGMAIPDYQTIMLPLLQLAADTEEHSMRQTVEKLGNQFQLTEEERKEPLPSGQQATFTNRVGWAITYMKKAMLLEATRKAHFKITERGIELLAKNPPQINVKLLGQYPEFVAFKTKTTDDKIKPPIIPVEIEDQTPEETIETAYTRIRSDLASDLLQQIMDCSPAFFERLVVDLLVKMGYGGSRKDAGQAVGKSSDGGIDGIIKEDRLGLDVIYIQAKRWEGVVGRPEIQKFVGALQGQSASKGIFITTSSFSKEASEYTGKISSKVILMGGETLANLMIDFNVGVSAAKTYEIKRVDSDYFMET